MSFKFDVSDELEETLAKILKKNRQMHETIWKKIEEIASRDESTIEFYKNMRYELSDYKRVHVEKSFVLMFKVFKKEKFILFDKLKHHDDAYKH